MTEPTRRPPRTLFWRVAPLILGFGGAALLQYFYGAHPTELLVMVPPANDDGSGIVLRVTRERDHKLIVAVEQRDRMKESHTVVVHTKLPRGHYHVDAWLQNTQKTGFSANFVYAGADAVEVPLSRQ